MQYWGMTLSNDDADSEDDAYPSPLPELSFLPAPYRGQPLYGAGRKESSGSGLG